MRLSIFFLALTVLAGLPRAIAADRAKNRAEVSTNILVVDLPSALRLVGARNLDVQLAREKLTEAKANYESAIWQFFPAIIPGVGYRRHDNLLQDVTGHVIDVHKDSYTVGPTIAAQLELGDAIYKKLAARQLITAAEFVVETQQQESGLVAVREYFDFARARAAVQVAGESVRIADDFAKQLTQAVEAGIVFKGDALRAEVQADKNRLVLRQAQEQASVSAARLGRTLRLEPKVELVTRDEDLVPLNLVATNAALDSLITLAWAARPEVKQSRALVAAAQTTHDGIRYGPLIPSLGAQVFAGGLGGSGGGAPRRFGESEDYQVTLGWRIGPGGLFDRGRVRSSEARLHIAQLGGQKLCDEIAREVVESQARIHSWSDQLSTAGHAVQAAEQALRLASQRKEYAVGVVLEHVLAEQDLTRSRLDYLNVVSEFNKAQYDALRAVGGVVDSVASRSN